MSTKRTAPHYCQEGMTTKKLKNNQGKGPNLGKAKKQRIENNKLNNNQQGKCTKKGKTSEKKK